MTTDGPDGGQNAIDGGVNRPGGRVRARPPGARTCVCAVLSAGVASVLFTGCFAIATAAEASGLGEVFLVSVMMLLFWAPMTLWSAWYVSLPAIIVLAALLAVAPWRYRLPESSSRWRLAGRVGFVVLVINGAWTLLLGLVYLMYAVGGMVR